MHILIIDDDEESRELLKDFLEPEGFVIHCALTGVEGIQLAGQCHPDLVLLDVLLPEMDGREVCQQIRFFSDVPIIMISALMTQIRDMVQGLNLGADDYLAKPLDLELLKARVLALLRRSGKIGWREEHPIYADPYMIVDLRHQRVCVQGRLISLTSLEYRLLELLVRNANQVVPAVEIMEELWPGRIQETTSLLRMYVKHLREAIEPEYDRPRYIITEHGLGYCFAAQTDIYKSFTESR